MGSNEMPELGSRISLISKADIRYEGKLFTVDPQDCTIALANVRSFGTEDRETQHPVPPQSQVYDYILFRATDIKDISVIPQQMVYDPAILQLSAPSNMESSSRGFSSSSGGGGGGSSGGFNHHPMMGLGSGGGPSASGGGFNPMQSGLQPLGPPRSQQPPKCVLDLLSASRSSTPGLRKVSPSVDQGIQAEIALPKDKSRNQQYVPRQGRGGSSQQQQMQNRNNPNSRNRETFQTMEYGRSWSREHPGLHYQNQRYQLNSNVHVGRSSNLYPQRQSRNGPMNRGGGGGFGPGGGQMGGQKWGGGGLINNRGGGGGMRGQHGMHIPGGIGGQMRNNGGGGGNNRPRNNFPRAPGAGTGAGGGAKKQPLKFETDYDFDKANTEFEELRVELAKVKIGGEEPHNNVQNGESEKKDDSGNETAVGDADHEEAEVFYDKAKSFFDNISCEAIERSKGRSQRTDWRKERKLNSETFGVAMARRQIGYRGGRGGGYYRGGGGYYQGNRRGYRGGNNKQRQQQPLPANLEVSKA